VQIQMVTFSGPKAGNSPAEWQDGAYGGVGRGGIARFIVADGATAAYDSLRWVDQLVTSFVPHGRPAVLPGGTTPPDPPELEPAAMRAWFAQMQDKWAAEAPAFDNVIEERKFAEVGSFATMLGFEIRGLDGPEPFWRAVALGDTVLFHVRAGRLVTAFPPLGPDDFGAMPDGVHTLRSSLDRMTDRLEFGGGTLAPGDLLFAATDALAHWIIRAIRYSERKVWDTLGCLVHPAVFARFVADQRAEADGAKRMKNDDVTLMRLRLLAGQPSFLLACR
jgi:hypothetical protein